MNKASLFLLAVCLIGGSLAFNVSDLAGTNSLKCLAEASITLSNAKQFIADSKANLLPAEDLFEEGINVFNEVYVLSRDCGVTHESFKPIEDLKELKNCFNGEDQEFLPALSALFNSAFEMDFSGVISNGILARVYLDQLKNSCITSTTAEPEVEVLQSSSISQCLIASGNFYAQVEQFQADKDSAALNVVVVEAYDIIEGLQPLVDVCGLSINLHIPQINFPDLSNCVVDTQSLVSTIQNIVSDFKQKKILQLLSDAQTAVIDFQVISDECKPTSTVSKVLAASLTKNPLICLKLTAALKKNIDALQTEYTQKDIPDLVVTGFTIVEGLQNLLNACQDTPADLHIPQINFVNLHDCVSNAEVIFGDIQAIKEDIVQKNWSNLFVTAQQAYAAYVTVKEDCSTTA